MTNIKTDAKTRDLVLRIDLMQGWDKRLVVMNTLMNPQIPQNVANILTALETNRFTYRTLLHTLSTKHDLYHSICRCNIKPKILQPHTMRNAFILTLFNLFLTHKVTTYFHFKI